MNFTPKLIRDKIPDLIHTNQQKCQVKKLDNKEYKQALKIKLVEEAKEVLNAEEDELIEEIADVYEVIDTLIQTYNLDKTKIAQFQQQKAEQKGKFNDRIQLISVSPIPNKKIIETTKKVDDLLSNAESFLQTEVVKKANEIDRDSEQLKQTLIEMNEIDRNFFRLKLTKQWGGLEFDNYDYYRWQMTIVKYSGALAFLQTQHQSAVSILSHSQQPMIKEKYLPKLVNENTFFGVGFSHLRKQGKPLVTAISSDNGYQINGFVPWITGCNIFDYFILGCSLPTGEELYAVLPFNSLSSSLKLSKPLSLSAMNSTNTVSATLQDYFLADEDVVTINPANTIHQKDIQNVLNHGFFPVGCSYGALEILAENCRNFDLPEIDHVYQNLKSQIDNLKNQMLTALSQETSFEAKLNLRVKAIDLAFRSAKLAVVSSKGKANENHNRANRIYREALVYSVSGQTLPVLTKTLQQIV